MGVSVFPGRENLVPNVERVARDACSKLAHVPRESIHERLRDVLSRLVEDLVLEGGVFYLPGEPQMPNIAIGSLPSSARALAECLGASRLQSIASHPDVLVVADPPHNGRATVFPPDDHLHLWALGIRTLILVPLYRQGLSRGAIALYSQRSQPQLGGAVLAPLSAVADAVRTAIESARGTRHGDSAGAETPDTPRRASTAADDPDAQSAPEDTLIGESAAWRYVVFRLEQVAATTASVLLLGETGTGKELVARAIHRRSARANAKFVALNCAALPPTLVESELFGRERGAFTGAHSSQVGRFEHAHRGTLFLDEVGDLPSELQPKLLRVLQEGQLERLGSARTVDVDVRVVAATNRDLAEEVRQNRFRDDLYYRLNVFPITLPSLRERREDIPLLAQHLANRFARAMHKPIKPLSDTVARALQQYDWPGNVRELENVVHRAMILSSDGVISLSDIALSAVRVTASVGTTLEEIERNHIQRMLSTTLWRIEGRRGAAELLGMKPSTLRSRLRKLGIRRGAERRANLLSNPRPASHPLPPQASVRPPSHRVSPAWGSPRYGPQCAPHSEWPVKYRHDRRLPGGMPRDNAAGDWYFAAGTCPAMHVATMNLRVRDDKRSEALSAIEGFIRRMRCWPGCLTCRLLADASDGEMLTLVSEWDSREGLDGFIASREFLILQGMRMVLRDDPQVILDEILMRSRMSLGARVR